MMEPTVYRGRQGRQERLAVQVPQALKGYKACPALMETTAYLETMVPLVRKVHRVSQAQIVRTEHRVQQGHKVRKAFRDSTA